MEIVAQLIRQSKFCCAYTGAGLSRSSGIPDYATKAKDSIVKVYIYIVTLEVTSIVRRHQNLRVILMLTQHTHTVYSLQWSALDICTIMYNKIMMGISITLFDPLTFCKVAAEEWLPTTQN